MGYLLDTHVVLWLANEPDKLTDDVQAVLLDKQTVIYFSAVSLWEIAIKSALKKANFVVDLPKLYQQLIYYNYLELPVISKYCLQVESLPFHHKDPFDRLLVAQAMSEGLTLITHDKQIWKYSLPVLKV